MMWDGTRIETRGPTPRGVQTNGSRVHHHDSVVKVQECRDGRRGEQKTRGCSTGEGVPTWRRLWPRGQRVSRERSQTTELLRLRLAA